MFLGLKLWKVEGHSMAPMIPSGSFLLASKWLKLFPIKEGQQLVINHPKYGFMVKTVALVDKNGFIWSKGENPSSISVEQMGPISKQQIFGRVVRIFKPESII